ncbi:hypothetical protein TTHERM_00096720 (macronuclear) [Tetrahymena thermophila SB210]|uniref:Transmembrane protein n=1 Tax=Tetrahymena thermophila (strain SB210) TaxID=312017 RepID=Q234X7_TETTS|nr:hypothetical protein TTHERM_00096720 [Tetrahymena thermophila SB210]EAR91876.2 hypothetical protein TTHERM_00096720 [Tetrahymena thermophila SB210]|eukprot:XP_001012121.2 hypothetical protein TTHERM_00096720 [Tetrahymena thermophila SB210]
MSRLIYSLIFFCFYLQISCQQQITIGQYWQYYQQRNALIVVNKDASQYQYWKLNSDGFITKTIILQACDLMIQNKDDQLLEFSNQLFYFIPSQQNYYLIDINNLESLQDQQTYTCGNPLPMLTSQGLQTNYFQSDGTSLYDSSTTFSLLTDFDIQNMKNINKYSIKDDIQDFQIDNYFYFFLNGVQYKNPNGCLNTQLFIVDKQNSAFLGSCLPNMMYLFNVNLNDNPLTLIQQYPQPSINTSYSDIVILDQQTRLVAICWAISGNYVWWFYQTNILTTLQMSSIPCQNQPQNQPIVFQNYFIVDKQIYSVSKSSSSFTFSNSGQLSKQYLPSHAYNYSQRFYKEKRTQIVIEQNNNGNIYLFMSMDYLVCNQNNSYVNQYGACQTCNQNQIFSKNQQCSPCSSNCTQCDSFTKCNTCASGYYLSNSSQCVKLGCPDNSSQINSDCVCNTQQLQNFNVFNVLIPVKIVQVLLSVHLVRVKVII